MCSSMSFMLIGDELIQLGEKNKKTKNKNTNVLADEQFHQANNK